MPISARIVGESSDRAWTVIAICAVLGTVAMVYIAQHFAMTTASLDLISADLQWRRNVAAFDQAFPQHTDLMVVVVDGATPELADEATAKLAAALSSYPDLFPSVRRPDGGSFFELNGLLLQPLPDVATATKQLISAQPFLGPLTADPSLRGLMSSLSAALLGVQEGETTLAELEAPIRA